MTAPKNKKYVYICIANIHTQSESQMGKRRVRGWNGKRKKNYLSIIFGALDFAQKAIENSAAFGTKTAYLLISRTHTHSVQIEKCM